MRARGVSGSPETGGHRSGHLRSHSPGRQQPVNQQDHLREGKKRMRSDTPSGERWGELLEAEHTGSPRLAPNRALQMSVKTKQKQENTSDSEQS